MSKPSLKVVGDDTMNEDFVGIDRLHEEIRQNEARFSEPERVMRRPEDIGIDPEFQRNISSRGKRLIRKMVSDWRWDLFTPPAIYLDKKTGRELAYDGQHTLIAAATRVDIDMLPMDLHVEITDQATAANSFVGRQTERLGVTSFQRYKAALVAGQYWAVQIQILSDKIGFKVPFWPNNNEQRPDVVHAIGTLKDLLELRGEQKFAQIMRTATGKNMRPIREWHLRAIDILLNDKTYRGVQVSRLDALLRLIDNDLLVKEVISDAAGSGMSRHQMAAITYYRRYEQKYGSVR